jgi:uncharacterized protein (TIGR00369 family)
MTETQDRTRTFSWADPALAATHLGRRSGLELLRAMIDGELPPPPVMAMMGAEGLAADEGRVVFTMPVREFHYNPLGTVHGGVLATLLDTAAGCAVHSVLPAGKGYTTLDLSSKFLRPVTTGSGTLRCEGTLLSQGRTTALAEARLTDPTGRLLAHATSTCLLFDAERG